MDSPKIRAIRAAQAITDQVFADIRPLLKAGISEKTLAEEIRRRGIERGASKLAFPVVIGSGPKGAEPNQKPGPRKLRRGDVVVIDFGFVVGGYCSDMTWTVAIDTASAKAKRVYEVVLKAQRAALKKVGAGITGTELDAVARNIITKAGYGARFIHTLGHGVGRKIHQAPRISPKRGGNRLQAGDVITIEPGIYLPREFGVRIEDMVVVTKAGSENLTRTSKRFII